MKKKKADKKTNQTDLEELRKKNLLWNDISFAASEAYNLLRTNLTLSFADEGEGAHFVGVTSTEHAEGKSLTSINLAASLAKANHRTLLLEGDLRLPVVAKYMDLDGSKGISDLLTGMAQFTEVVQNSGVYPKLHVLPCGQIPPNPSELLSSKRMSSFLNGLRQYYDYVIVDLPPVGAVSDPLVLSNMVDGMIVVVRHDVTTQPVLADVIRQLRYVNAKILGFVYNGAATSGRGYRKKYYKKYYYSKETDETSDK